MPKGVYKAVTKILQVGDVVEVCLPDAIATLGVSRHYLSKGICQNGTEPVVKKVMALATDTVELTMSGVKINGYQLPHSATLMRDERGRLIPYIKRKAYKLSANEVWLYGSEDPKSWDSRYYGHVNMKNIQHIMTPVWTW